MLGLLLVWLVVPLPFAVLLGRMMALGASPGGFAQKSPRRTSRGTPSARGGATGVLRPSH